MSVEEEKNAPYQCSRCTRMRQLKVNRKEHKSSVEESSNGLVFYSDIHRCENGILGINNLQVDHNFAIRSIENLQLPTERKPFRKSLPGLPMPTKKKHQENEMKKYLVTNLFKEKDYRIRIIDVRLRATIIIGKIDHRKEKMISLIQSDQGTIDLEYYASDVELNTSLEKWLYIVVNLLEKLPPTTLGLFLETLLFVNSHHYNFPNIFLTLQLQTIIQAHHTFFKLEIEKQDVEDKMAYVESKYGDEVAQVMKDLISYLVDNPLKPLLYYTRTHSENLEYLVNMFLILEQESIISITRPTIKDEKILN